MERAPRSVRPVLTTLALGALLAAPLAVEGRDRLALLAWLTLLAAPVGALFAGPAAAGRRAAAVLAVFGSGLCWVAVPAPAPAAFGSTVAALGGLVLVGAALGRAAAERVAGPLAGLVLVGVALSSMAQLGGLWCGAPWAPEVAARWLDLSPLSLTAESAGVDWMRHPFVYEAAGTASIGPELRSGWGGLAGPLSFVVGCVLVLAVHTAQRPGMGPEGPAT